MQLAHANFINTFRNMSSVQDLLPLASIGIRPDPDVYHGFVGIIELGCALLIIAGIPKARLYALFVLLVVMIGAIYSHVALHDPVNNIVPAVVALVLVLTLLYLDGAVSVKIKTN